MAPKRDSGDDYAFPDPTSCFRFAVFDFAMGLYALSRSVVAGVIVLLVAAFIAAMGVLKKRRIIR